MSSWQVIALQKFVEYIDSRCSRFWQKTKLHPTWLTYLITAYLVVSWVSCSIPVKPHGHVARRRAPPRQHRWVCAACDPHSAFAWQRSQGLAGAKSSCCFVWVLLSVFVCFLGESQIFINAFFFWKGGIRHIINMHLTHLQIFEKHEMITVNVKYQVQLDWK